MGFQSHTNWFKHLLSFGLPNLHTTKDKNVKWMILIVYYNGFGEVYHTTHFGSTITVQDE